MKSKIYYLLFCTFLFLLVSCQEENKKENTAVPIVDINARKANIVGNWTLDLNRKWKINGNTEIENIEQYDISFYEDGSGVKYTDTSTVDFNWFYQFGPEKFMLIYQNDSNGIFGISDDNQIYTVTKNTQTEQGWTIKFIGVGPWDEILEVWMMNRL
ncbi:MAG: hypothetical protein AB8G15_06085 [Saprospiraceae bacterium]